MNKLPSDGKKTPVFRILIPVFLCLAIVFGILISRGNMQLLEPAGYIANIQSRILWGGIIFAAIVGGSIVTAFFLVTFRYREGKHAAYEPNWTAGKKTQFLGWGIPFIGILALSVMVWDTAHLVDPYQPIHSSVAPVNIQVVALPWKWLFIYPNDRIASVNFIEIPIGTPVAFQLTANAPMNSFWIPRLSGQVYAMTGMVTQLHIEANKPGDYFGSPAELSGDNFSGMDFTVKAVSPKDYATWKATTQKTPRTLDNATYTQLAKPSSNNPQTIYTVPDPNLFQTIVLQSMVSDANTSGLTMQRTASS